MEKQLQISKSKMKNSSVSTSPKKNSELSTIYPINHRHKKSIKASHKLSGMIISTHSKNMTIQKPSSRNHKLLNHHTQSQNHPSLNQIYKKSISNNPKDHSISHSIHNKCLSNLTSTMNSHIKHFHTILAKMCKRKLSTNNKRISNYSITIRVTGTHSIKN